MKSRLKAWYIRYEEEEESRFEIEENRRPKRLAFSVEVLSTEPSEGIRGGKENLQMLLLMFLTRERRDLYA